MKRKPDTGADCGRSSTRSATTRDQSAGLVDGLQLFAGFEADCFAGWNVDFCAGARVAPDAGLARPHSEDTEAPQFDAIAARERFLHALKHGFDRLFGLGLGNAGLVDNFVDQIQFDHKWLRYVRSPVPPKGPRVLQRFYPTCPLGRKSCFEFGLQGDARILVKPAPIVNRQSIP